MNTRPSASSHEAPAESHERRTQLSRHLGLREDDALLVIDMQCDFLPGGALGVPAGDQVIAPLNSYIDAFAARDLPIFFTRDWHPQNHCSFETAGGRWPPHCVRDTAGAAWAPGLRIPRNARIISKAQEPTAEAYSGFSGTQLLQKLRDLNVKRVFVGGLATDYCVHDTVVDARSHGFEVVVLADACRAVNAQPGDETRAIDDMLAHGAALLEASQVAPPAS